MPPRASTSPRASGCGGSASEHAGGLQVNGEAIELAQRTMEASYGSVCASDCQVAWAAEPALDCGLPNKLCLYAKALEDGAAPTNLCAAPGKPWDDLRQLSLICCSALLHASTAVPHTHVSSETHELGRGGGRKLCRVSGVEKGRVENGGR